MKRWKCLLCGRDSFERKSPHKCKDGFRKKGIKWVEVDTYEINEDEDDGLTDDEWVIKQLKKERDSFEIRSYGYAELSLLYFPKSSQKSASTQLGRWIRQNESLKRKLIDTGFSSGKKILTPKQVKIIFEILGEPSNRQKKLFETEEDAIKWIELNIAWAIKPKNDAKKLIYPFTSSNAQQQVIEHLGKDLFKHQESIL